MIVSTLLLTIQDAITKWLTVDFHAGEILFYRGIFTFVPIVFLVAWAGNWRILISRDLTGTLIRAALGAATSIFVILSFVLFAPGDGTGDHIPEPDYFDHHVRAIVGGTGRLAPLGRGSCPASWGF